MVKTYQKLEFFNRFSSNSLSICENRNNNLAVTKLNSGRLQSRSVPKRLDLCRGTNKLRIRAGGLSKSLALFERGHRNVSSLTIELIALIYKAPDKSAIQDKAKKAEVSSAVLTPFLCQCHPSWVPPLKSTVLLKGE